MIVAADMMVVGAAGTMTDAVLHAAGVAVAGGEGEDEDTTMIGIVGTIMEGIGIGNTMMTMDVADEVVGTVTALIIEAMGTVRVLEDTAIALPPLVRPTISQLLRCVPFSHFQSSGAEHINIFIACR
jgi:hypothetical protein